MNKLAIALGVALVGTGMLFLHLLRESSGERQRAAQLEARLAALESAQRAASSWERPANLPETGGVISSAGRVASDGAPNGAQPSDEANPLAAMREQLMDSAEGREFTRAMLRMNMEQQYPDVAKEMGLSPEEVEKLFDLLARRTMDGITDMMAARAGSDRAAQQEVARLLAEKEQVYQGELATLLGGRYPQWQDYDRRAQERRREINTRQGMEQLRGAVSPAGNALNDAQFQALHAALDAEEKRINQESRGGTVQQEVQRLPETHRRLIEVAATHLNAQQLEGYRRYLQQQADMIRMVSGATGGQ